MMRISRGRADGGGPAWADPDLDAGDRNRGTKEMMQPCLMPPTRHLFGGADIWLLHPDLLTLVTAPRH